MPVREKELLAAAKRGDTRAVDELLARHERQVYRFGLRMCGSEEAAKEVLQQTLLTAFKGLREFRGDAALSTWLYQIARSVCMKERRRRVDEPEPGAWGPLEHPGVRAIPAASGGPEEVAHARQIGEALQAAILALPANQREVIILRDVEGLSAEEAAEVLGIEVPALKSRLHRARMELRRHLTALLEPEGAAPECPELMEELAAYAAQDIDQAACIRIEAHLERCPRCADACDALKRTVSLCRSIPGDEVPAPVRAAVRQALGRIGAPVNPS